MLSDEQLARALHGAGLLTSEQIQSAARVRKNGEKLGQAILRLELLAPGDILAYDPTLLDNAGSSQNSAQATPTPAPKKTMPAPELTPGIVREATDLSNETFIVVNHDDTRDPSMAPVVRWANEMLKLAISTGASDVHFEPRPGGLLPRYRIDGQLQAGQILPPELSAPLISRIKVLGGLDITESRLPQDGRFRGVLGDKIFDFRVSSLPSLHGEKIVLRLLDHSSLVTDLGRLGFSRRDRATFERMLGRSHGMILVTGPTGSGKTTTLYAALAATRDDARNVLTIEDPVEYELEGVTQTSINTDIHLTFATVLRATLRQDPDVILVGEIRDEETADIGVRAALTGHLLLSTLHTNSAVAAITRLQNMGIASYLLASSLAGILAQRLGRLSCRYCRDVVDANDERRAEWAAFFDMPVDAPFQEGKGCEHCNNRGTRGRVAIVEILETTTNLRRAIMAGDDADALRHIAREEGFRSMIDDAREKILAGFLSPGEAMKVLMGHEE